MLVVAVSEENLTLAKSFLSTHEETSQFLLNNLAEHGPSLTKHPNSGNFKMILEKGEVKGVFVLARRGNLLAQTTEDFSELILGACAQEPLEVKGFIGHELSVLPVAKLFRERHPSFKPVYESREILYRYEWKSEQLPSKHNPDVRLLTPSDFTEVAPLSAAYMAEFGLPEQTSAEDQKRDFSRGCERKVQWGLFQGSRLVSKASLNSCGQKIGQVGGVYTVPALRRRGLSKAVMLHLLEDCRRIHGHTKNILFTGTADVPAQKLYESIGYERIGHFTILFGA